MIDYNATKTLEINGNSYVIGKVSKKVFAMFMCNYAECDTAEKYIATAYNYVAFFLKSATVGGVKMPEPISESDGRTTVKHADYEWIADNIDGTDMMELVKECVEYNTVSEDDKKK